MSIHTFVEQEDTCRRASRPTPRDTEPDDPAPGPGSTSPSCVTLEGYLTSLYQSFAARGSAQGNISHLHRQTPRSVLPRKHPVVRGLRFSCGAVGKTARKGKGRRRRALLHWPFPSGCLLAQDGSRTGPLWPRTPNRLQPSPPGDNSGSGPGRVTLALKETPRPRGWPCCCRPESPAVGGGAPRQACPGARLVRSAGLTRPGAQLPVLGLFTQGVKRLLCK